MSSRSNNLVLAFRPHAWPGCRTGLCAAVFACAALATPALAQTAGHPPAITFCVDQANPMVAIDEAVANAVAANQHVAASFVVRNSADDDEDQDSGAKQRKFFAQLVKSCDLVMDFPVEPGQPTALADMDATRPYARTGFVTIGPREQSSSFAAMPGSASLSDMLHRGDIGVVFLTVASTYFDAATMSHEHIYESNAALYDALGRGEVQSAIIWQPWLLQRLATDPGAVTASPLRMPHATWNIVAIYPQDHPNMAAVHSFNAGLAALSRDGGLARAVAPYKLPQTSMKGSKER
jgi:polar amino acid transport system substrate-binding protein